MAPTSQPRITSDKPFSPQPDASPCSEEETPTKRPGRPVTLSREQREALIFAAMERVVVEKGVQGASMAAIASEAGMSKRTLYTLYESRESLFLAWLRGVRASFVRPLPEDARAKSLRERLVYLLMPEARAALAPERVLAILAVMNEAQHSPTLGRAFLREGPEAARAIIAEELARSKAAGEISIDDPEAAAALLFDMVCSSPFERMIDPDRRDINLASAETRARLGIEIFLNGVTRSEDRDKRDS